MFMSYFFSSDAQPVSRSNMSKKTSLVAQEKIRVASICIFPIPRLRTLRLV